MAVNNMSSMLMVMAVVVLGTASTATAASGVAMFYDKYTPSAFYENMDMGNMVAAASDSFWNNGVVCGQCYRV
uniref:Expansin-like EG45 domain-containing protein n=1 Tax=Setaria italica TaxID=4555 RepID=A0A0Q3SVU5_SETIT